MRDAVEEGEARDTTDPREMALRPSGKPRAKTGLPIVVHTFFCVAHSPDTTATEVNMATATQTAKCEHKAAAPPTFAATKA